jgi:hypothetical protein
MKKIILLWILLTGYSVSKAYQINWGGTLVISKPLYEDLYIVGGNVTINAPVYGDVIIAGGTLNLNEKISNDLLLAGGTVNINGYVGDDVRCAGGELHVLQNVGGDLVITGGKVEVAQDVMIYGGLMASGGDLIINGTIQDFVKLNAGKITFNGTAIKGLESRSDKLTMNGVVHGPSTLAARKMEIGNAALFYNDVRYWNKDGSIDFKQSVKKGKAVFDASLKIKGNDWYYLGRGTVVGLIWYLSTVFLFILLLEYLFSKTFKKAAATVSSSMARSLLWGFVFFLAIPIAMGVCFLSRYTCSYRYLINQYYRNSNRTYFNVFIHSNNCPGNDYSCLGDGQLVQCQV